MMNPDNNIPDNPNKAPMPEDNATPQEPINTPTQQPPIPEPAKKVEPPQPVETPYPENNAVAPPERVAYRPGVEMNAAPTISTKKFFFVSGIIVAAFLFIFYLILLWGLFSGNVSNPIFEIFGVKQDGLKHILTTTTNFVFGGFTLILFLVLLVKIFRGISMRAGDVGRTEIFKSAGKFFLSFIVFTISWIGFYYLIESSGLQTKKNYDSFITTNLNTLVGLSSPITIEFDVEEKLYQQMDKKNILQIVWDFDDDGEMDASGPKVIHKFTDKGENDGRYNVAAYVYFKIPGTEKERIAKSQREVIIANEKVIPTFSATPESGEIPLEVVLDASASRDPDGEIIAYEWDLDEDGVYEIRSETPKTSFVYTKIGDHKVTLRVTGSNTQDFGTTEKVIAVKSPASDLRAEITSENGWEGTPPFRVVLDGGNSFIREGSITKYLWKIKGEDNSVESRRIQRMFRKEGDYDITLTIENDIGQRSEVTKTIRVRNPQNPQILNIRTTPAVKKDETVLTGVVPFTVSFDTSSSKVLNPVEWGWDFDDDGIEDANGKAIQHVFRKPGTYDVKLTIIDTAGESYEKIQRVIVERSGVRAKISADPLSGSIPLEVTFDASGSSTDTGKIVDYIWEFPNGDPIHSDSKIRYLFKTIGTHEVNLTILTSTGKTASTKTLVSARTISLNADFNMTPSVGYAPLDVSFDPSPTRGVAEDFFWDFGVYPRRKSREYAPKFTYETPGEYTVELKIVDKHGVVSRKTKRVVVEENKN